MECKRGDVWYADLGKCKGSEQCGNRPVVIIQNDVGNAHSTTIVVAAITDASKRHMPTHVPIETSGGLYKESTVMLEQIRTIDKLRLCRKLTELSEFEMLEVDEALKISCGLIPVRGRR